MTPREKARELFDKFKKNNKDTIFNAKKCALIAVDEIIKDQNGDDSTVGNKVWWWQQVKQEIEQL